MAAKRAPLPPIARTVTPLEWVIVLGLWLVLEVASADPLVKEFAARGVVVELDHVRMAQCIDWVVWALLLRLIYLTLDRFPLRGRLWFKHGPIWLVAALGFGLVHAALSLPLILLLARVLGVAPNVLSVPELTLARMTWDDTANFSLIVFSYVTLQFVHRIRDERAQGREMERSLRESKLHALALELQPHFLFNSLNGIAALVRSEPRTAEQMLVKLSDLLRLTLDSGRDGQLPLAEEFRRLGLYLGLQQMRHGTRLRVVQTMPEDLATALVPSMVLQTLSENAISHGIGGRPGPGTLWIGASREGEQLVLTVEDDGVGVGEGGPARQGIGLGNTKSRLAALYPEDHQFSIGPRAGGGTRVVIRIPLTANLVEQAQ